MSVPSENDEKSQKQKKPSEVNVSKAFHNFRRLIMGRREFYLLIGIRFGFSLVTNTVPSYYKAFGLALGCRILNLMI